MRLNPLFSWYFKVVNGWVRVFSEQPAKVPQKVMISTQHGRPWKTSENPKQLGPVKPHSHTLPNAPTSHPDDKGSIWGSIWKTLMGTYLMGMAVPPLKGLWNAPWIGCDFLCSKKMILAFRLMELPCWEQTYPDEFLTVDFSRGFTHPLGRLSYQLYHAPPIGVYIYIYICGVVWAEYFGKNCHQVLS